MGNLLTFQYWLDLRPASFNGWPLKIILGFIVLLLILTVICSLGKKKWAKSLYAAFWGRAYFFFLTNVIIGLVLIFFNYEMVPFLSARFWFLLWGVSIIIWLVGIYKIIIKIPQKKAQAEKEKEFKKYIP
jgi:hypothetical protein